MNIDTSAWYEKALLVLGGSSSPAPGEDPRRRIRGRAGAPARIAKQDGEVLTTAAALTSAGELGPQVGPGVVSLIPVLMPIGQGGRSLHPTEAAARFKRERRRPWTPRTGIAQGDATTGGGAGPGGGGGGGGGGTLPATTSGQFPASQEVPH